MASLTATTTIFHNSSQHHLSFAPPSHSHLYHFANERSNHISTPVFWSSGSVRNLAANIRERSVANRNINAIVLDNNEIDQANEMVQLTSLRLRPSAHKRGSSSMGNLEILTAAPASSTSATRPRIQSSVAALNTLPYTQEEWKFTMEEIKDLFMKRQYKRCSTRSKQILDNTEDPSQFHPLYAIYLCFYTAVSLEQIARSLHSTSPTKLPLLNESLKCFHQALSSLSTASFTATPKIIRLTERARKQKRNSKSSISSSNRSSIDSIFSQVSSTSDVSDSSSRPTSRTEKVGEVKGHRRNLSSMEMKPAPLRIQKKVSFSQQLPTLISQAELRFEESEDLALIDCFPLPPPFPSQSSSLEPQSDREEDSESCKQSLAVTRYQNHLTTFSNQLEYHIDFVNAQIGSLTSTTTRCPSRGDFSHVGGEGLGLGIGGVDGVENEEIRKVELQERLQRLKARGWERKRFDASKYQMLCERALLEVEGC